jgi:hypothetical protein
MVPASRSRNGILLDDEDYQADEHGRTDPPKTLSSHDPSSRYAYRSRPRRWIRTAKPQPGPHKDPNSAKNIPIVSKNSSQSSCSRSAERLHSASLAEVCAFSDPAFPRVFLPNSKSMIFQGGTSVKSPESGGSGFLTLFLFFSSMVVIDCSITRLS